jgi:thymidylate synthase (FAD)
MSHDAEYPKEAYCPSREDDDLTYKGPRFAPDKRWSTDEGRSRSPSDNGVIQVGMDGIDVVLVQDFDDAVLYRLGRWSVSASTGAHPAKLHEEDELEFLSGGLARQSLEDIRIAFGVRGASRVLTHQLVRTRQAAFKQQSQRDSWMGAMPEFRMPEKVWNDPTARAVFLAAIISAHHAYLVATTDCDVPYEDARYILPEGTTNFILCEYSLRTFIDMYAYRGCYMFQEEMVTVMHMMRDLLVSQHPYLEDHIRISCEPIHKCTFQGRGTVEGKCLFPWAREDNRTHPAKVES